VYRRAIGKIADAPRITQQNAATGEHVAALMQLAAVTGGHDDRRMHLLRSVREKRKMTVNADRTPWPDSDGARPLPRVTSKGG
jgi:hypothetical protein